MSARTLLWIAIGLYAAFAAIRIALALFPKTIDVMPDELRYLDLARSLFTDGTLTIRGEDSTFQKVLYPLLLFPAMFFNDTVSQVRAIGVLSSLYVCTAVFPTFLIAKRVFGNRLLPNVTAQVLVLAMPDMCYSMTFMSESVFFPLALWLAYLMWVTLCNTTRRYPVLCLCSGLACYAVYLCKEVAAAYAIAFCVMLVILAIRKSRPRTDCIMGIACFLVGFLAPFVILKATLFDGMGNSYNQMDPGILFSPYTWAFAIYALVTDFTYLVVGFGFFCLAFPLLGWKKFDSDQKRLLAFSLLAIGVGAPDRAVHHLHPRGRGPCGVAAASALRHPSVHPAHDPVHAAGAAAGFLRLEAQRAHILHPYRNRRGRMPAGCHHVRFGEPVAGLRQLAIPHAARLHFAVRTA